MQRKNQLASKIIGIIIIVFTIIIASTIFMMFYNTKKTVKATLGEHSIAVAQNIASYLDIEGYKQLANNPQENDLYWALREQLNDLREKNGVLYAYTFMPLSENSGDYGVFLVDGMPADDTENAGTIGTTSNATTTAHLKAAETDHYYYSDLLESEFGQFISGTIPVRDANGQTVAYLGIDLDAKYVKNISNTVTKEIVPLVILLFTIIAIASLSFLYIYIKRALLPLRTLKEAASYLAEGNMQEAKRAALSVNLTNENEVSAFAKDYTNAVQNLTNTFTTVHDATGDLAHVVTNMNTTAHNVKESNMEIASHIASIAESSMRQKVSNDEVMQAMNEMVVGIQRLADTTSDIAESSSDMTHLVEGSATNSRQVASQIQLVEATVVNTAEQVREMGNRLHSIEEIITVITSIADQTNLLALNAAIEAARAGEAGKGFAVVADEVRKLAEMSRTSAENIHEHLQSFLAIASQAISEMEVSTEGVKEGSRAVTAIGDNLQLVLQSVVRVNDNIQENSAVIEQMSASSEQILASADEMNRLVSSTTAETQQVAISIDHQVEMVEKLNDVVELLATTSENVVAEINKFKLR